ncbi:unnamed protein product [Peniophora sp. CBMAI 1063]|nr:unnamed protein product [Peniophora sp. CBMAI 1063]
MSSQSFPAGDKPLVTLTRPSPTVWQLEIHHAPDNRLTRAVVQTGLRPALDAAESEWRTARNAALKAKDKSATAGAGALVIVGMRGQAKFFSNGFDYQSVVADPTWFTDVFDPFLVRLLTFPMPTVAAINGHCFAAGLITSLACDYRVMTDGSKRNAWLCMNEIDFGANWPSSFAAIARHKLSAPTIRTLALEGHRFTPSDALKAGILDAAVPGGTEAVLSAAVALAESKAGKARAGTWGLIKHELYRPIIEVTKTEYRPWNTQIDEAAARARLAKL